MLYVKESAEDHLELFTRFRTHIFVFVVLYQPILRCWVLSLVEIGMKMHKVIKKYYLVFI